MGLYLTKSEYEEENFTETNRAANLCILRKVADVMGKTELLYNTERRAKKGILGLSENTVSRICTLSYEPTSWDVEAVAKKLQMDRQVFTGETLIRIKGEGFTQFQKEYIKVLKTERLKSGGNSEKLEMIKELSEIIPTEELLWVHILRTGKEEEAYQTVRDFKKLLWKDLSKQIREENFEDLQLWKFWHYLKTH